MPSQAAKDPIKEESLLQLLRSVRAYSVVNDENVGGGTHPIKIWLQELF